MSRILNISLCFILTLNFGYSQSIKRNVISSFGASSNTANSIVETTFGQPPNIGTISDGSNYVRQGFQQPLYNFIMIPGCTDPTALNYDPLATVDDGSCCYSSFGSVWNQIGQDIDGEAAGDNSGYSVSISDDGNIVAIGAPYNADNGHHSGHTRIYKNINGTWNQLGSDINGGLVNAESGWSVDLSSDGHIVAIGEPAYNFQGGEGMTRVFSWDGVSIQYILFDN